MSSPSPASGWASLLPDLAALILHYLNTRDAMACLCACRAWRGWAPIVRTIAVPVDCDAPRLKAVLARFPGLRAVELTRQTSAKGVDEVMSAAEACWDLLQERSHITITVAGDLGPEGLQLKYASGLADRGIYPDLALSLLRRVASNPVSVGVVRYRVLHQLQRLPEAIDEVKALLGVAHQFPQELLRRRLIAMLAQTRRYKEAIEHIKVLMELLPGIESSSNDAELAELQSLYGACLFEDRQYEAALEQLDKAAEVLPDDVRILNYRAETLNSLGNVELAVDAFRRAITANPENTGMHHGLAVALHELGRSEESVSAYTTAIDLGGETEPLYFGRALAHFRCEEYDATIADAKHCITLLGHDNFNICALLSAAALEAKRMPEALEWSTRTLELAPHHAVALRTRGKCLSTMGRYAEAYVDFKRAFVLTDHSDGYGLLISANTFLALGKAEELLAIVRLFSVSPSPERNEAWTLYLPVTLLRVLGRFDEAKQRLQLAEARAAPPKPWEREAELIRCMDRSPPHFMF